MNNSKFLSVSKDTVYYLSTFSPLAFSMAVCFGFSATLGALFAILTVLLAPKTKNDKIMPVYLSFMLLGVYANNVLSCIICATLLIASSFFFDKLKTLFAQPVVSGVMLASALTATILFTTDYFGIGATGATVRDMIKSYISLGFHPNWRGVLYGTIVMVMMITFPRKFKKFTKTVSAPFIAIAVTLILNLFLNPSDMVSAITEIEHNDLIWLKEFFLMRSNISFSIKSIVCGIALFVVCFYAISSNDNAQKNDYIIGGISNGAAGAFCSLPLPYGINKEKSSVLPRVLAAIIALLIFCFGKEIIARIPVHSCAVVIIVGAWQSVKWGELKKVFSGIAPVVCFTVTVIGFLLFDLAFGIIFAAVISLIYSFVFSKKDAINS